MEVSEVGLDEVWVQEIMAVDKLHVQGRGSCPGRPSLGLTTFSPPAIFCACATAHGSLNFELVVDVCDIMALSKQVTMIYPAISAKPHQPVSFEFPRETLGSRWLWKEAVSQPGLRSGLGYTTAKMMIACSAIRVWRRSRNWRCLLEMLKTRLWHENPTIEN